MKLPFLKNVRYGFATNSSSSHSFVYLKEPAPDAHDNVALSKTDYSWNDFRISTIKEKLFYILAGKIPTPWLKEDALSGDYLYEQYHEEFPEFTKEELLLAQDSSVDHASVNNIDTEEARDPRVVVFGGRPSPEREKAVASSAVDWSRTPLLIEDEENIPEDDEMGQRYLRFLKNRKFI